MGTGWQSDSQKSLMCGRKFFRETDLYHSLSESGSFQTRWLACCPAVNASPCRSCHIWTSECYDWTMTKASALVQRWPSTSQTPCMCLGWNERTRTLTFSSDKISKLETEHLSLPNAWLSLIPGRLESRGESKIHQNSMTWGLRWS